MLISGLTHAHTQLTDEPIDGIKPNVCSCAAVLFTYKTDARWIYYRLWSLNHWFRDKYVLSQKCVKLARKDVLFTFSFPFIALPT